MMEIAFMMETANVASRAGRVESGRDSAEWSGGTLACKTTISGQWLAALPSTKTVKT
jgi:hypothetical protein